MDKYLLSPEVAGNGAVAGLATCAFAGETTFADEAGEEVGDAVGREGKFEGIADIAVGDGVLRGEEGGESLFDISILDVESHAVWFLIHLETLDFLKEFMVGLEVDAGNVNVLAVIEAVAQFHVAFKGKPEGADTRQADGITFLHLM